KLFLTCVTYPDSDLLALLRIADNPEPSESSFSAIKSSRLGIPDKYSSPE
ncbi:11662_t:CDS:2, partial [Rhizophagus irregularis]